ncbi:MAG: mannitol dehydrogenase family protein [Woeseia sp.]
MAVPRLSGKTLAALDPAVRRPRFNRETTGIGVVHLGVGAFMRSHIAEYCDDALAAESGDWAIAGVSLRRPATRDRLSPQDCLYVLGTRDGAKECRRLIGALRSMHVAPESPHAVVRLLAEPHVRVVTLTITEKGYCLEPGSGELALDHPDIRHDLEHPDVPRSAIAFLAAGLKSRMLRLERPPDILSCDNLPANGRRLRSAVLRFAHELDPALETWIADNVAFPVTMVDRIVPATTEFDIDQNAAQTGLRDAAYVKTEPFRQWVLEDTFGNRRPAWEAGGALFVNDVAPFEAAKLQLLNGPHSTIAYLGYLAGFRYVHEVMRNPDFAEFIRQMMISDISPVTPEPREMNHAVYIEELLRRFRNAALEHRTWQIAMDGSQKLPQRILSTVRAQLRRGGPVASLGLAVAGWMRFALGRDELGQPIEVSDPLAAKYAAIAANGLTDPDDVVGRFLAIREIFGVDLPEQVRFRSTVSDSFRQLLETGAAETVRRFIAMESQP